MALSESTAVAFILAPIMELHRSNRVLPYSTYLPYSIEELHAYLVTYLIHAISIIYGALLNKNFLTIEFCSFVLYTGSMMFQIFCYCWYGNELRLKSKGISDAIYNSNWITSTPNDRKNLQLLMRISQKELTLTYHRIFSLNLNVFTWVSNTNR
ncbi:hypothetical protein M0802_000019 [Mischocyttarus mexicanus]|nr:hypothetical protein M0802_000019 [Mischocyttarus mexicanus]